MSGDVEAMAGRLERVDAFVNDPVSLMPRLINPDGPEAAAMLRALQAENERLREALRKCAYAADGWEIDQANSAARAALAGGSNNANG